MKPETISISIESQGAETRQLVASLINDKLTEAGFIDIDVGVATREDSTGRVIEHDQLPSLLDEMRAVNPQCFERPVKILALPYSTDGTMDHDGPLLLKDNLPQEVELEPGQGRLVDGTVIDLDTYIAPNGVRLIEALIEVAASN